LPKASISEDTHENQPLDEDYNLIVSADDFKGSQHGDEVVGSDTELKENDVEPVNASTPSKGLVDTLIEDNSVHPSPVTSQISYLDLTPAAVPITKNTTDLHRSSSGYELPISPGPNTMVRDADKTGALSSTASSTDMNTTWSLICDHYRTLPLPNSPWHSFREGQEEACNSSNPPSLDPRNYTPLIEEEQRNQSLTSSVSSGIGIKAYEKDISFGAGVAPSNSKKTEGDGNYASLATHSKREADVRRESLLKPCYVISIGVGHIDYRKPNKRGSKTAEFFKALSSVATPTSQTESMLIAWKIC